MKMIRIMLLGLVIVGCSGKSGMAKVEYPEHALENYIQGYVILEFTVTKTGTTKDIKVVKADPPGVFEKAALKAGKNFRYHPKVVNGEAVELTGVRNKVIFELGSANKKEP
jgi:protein TonB